MIYLHFIAAILATWRITELFTQDHITESIRKRLNSYLFSCPRCMSVWSGAWCTLMFALGPSTHDVSRWSLWPFALAWLYLVRIEAVYTRRIAQEGRRLVVEARGPAWTMTRNDFQAQETQEILARIMTQLVQAQQPAAPMPPPAQPVNGGVKAKVS